MSWDRLPPLSTYPKARRKEMVRHLGNLLRRRPHSELLNLEDVQDRLHSYEQSYIGMRPIRVDEIVGSVARSSDFDDEFLPRSTLSPQRWQSLENRFPDGGFPPISVYKVGEAYFVADGHHRVAIAKQRKTEFIDAEIIEVHTQFEVTADTDVTRLVHLGLQRLFLEESGLGALVPGARFTFTRPQGYPELLDHVKVHGWNLIMSRGEYISREEIARSWFETVYLPTIKEIKKSRLSEMMERVTVDDIFLWVADRWRHLFPERGSLSFEQIVREAAEDESTKLSTKAKTTVDRLIRKPDRSDD
jgi:hypothetical protein